MAGVCTNPTHGHGESAVPDFMGEMPDSPSEEWNPCHAAGDTASSWGGGGGGWILPPILCLVFGKASGHGTVIPAVNTDFTGLLIGTIWQRGASHPLQSRCFPVPESHHQLSERLSASSGLLGGPVRWSW